MYSPTLRCGWVLQAVPAARLPSMDFHLCSVQRSGAGATARFAGH